MSNNYVLNDSEQNSYSRITVLLNNQRMTGEFCDIKIIINGIILYAHSAVVINFSTYIRNQCLNKSNITKKYSNYTLNSPLTINIDKNTRINCVDCVKSILNFIYLNRVEITPPHMVHITQLNTFLGIDDMLPLFLSKISSMESLLGKRKTIADVKSINPKTFKIVDNVPDTTKTSMLPKILPKTFERKKLSIARKNLQCKLHTCLRCNYQCYKPSNLLVHLRSSKFCQSEKTCSLCGTQFDSAVNVLAHLRLHDHPKPFFCTSCDQRFQSRTTLSQHIPKHSKETPFVCPHCRKGFKWKHGLTSHLVVHSKEMKHLCDECGFSTAHAKTLRAHKLVHTGDLLRCPYPGCTHSSQRKENLKIHVATHNKETPFVCEICGHKFSQSKNLKRHSRIHDPQITHHQCPHRNCDFKTPRTDKLREHIIRQHKTELSDDVQDTLTTAATVPTTVPNSQRLEVLQPTDETKLENFILITDYLVKDKPSATIFQNLDATIPIVISNSHQLEELQHIDGTRLENIILISDNLDQDKLPAAIFQNLDILETSNPP